jgi:hypothetical protein
MRQSVRLPRKTIRSIQLQQILLDRAGEILARVFTMRVVEPQHETATDLLRKQPAKQCGAGINYDYSPSIIVENLCRYTILVAAICNYAR